MCIFAPQAQKHEEPNVQQVPNVKEATQKMTYGCDVTIHCVFITSSLLVHILPLYIYPVGMYSIVMVVQKTLHELGGEL